MLIKITLIGWRDELIFTDETVTSETCFETAPGAEGKMTQD